MSIIESNIESICQLCKKHHVDSMSVFGSVLTDRFDANSDVDFLVSFKALPIEEYANNYFQLMLSLSELLGREVDLVEEKAIRNPVFHSNVNRTKVQLYG
ncbi:MAG: nucleotidyltransferase domain-containing protein [Bacteroidales bacterium]|nr:nucleotidyltransferase domain-containing protein [Bacteroidales bacterium]MBR3411823.1 nucleotidyltransferase domain-containing protein [Bacteroidales bacterium]